VDLTQLRSLGLRTDLALLQLSGTQVEDNGDHVVVRSPHNPLHWWGNFLLLKAVPPAEETDRWLDRFTEAFPEARHRTFAFDGTTGTVDDLAAWTERGLSCEAQTVMTATSVHAPPRPNDQATYRRLRSDDDWAASVALRTACDDGTEDPADRLEYDTIKVASNREMAEAGHGGWFGAFVDGELVAQMGLYRASEGLARFQSVETHPDFRGRGLAGTLVHHVSEVGFTELEARTLVMVADPTYLAIRVYRSVGFADTESQLQAERSPRDG
jgi:ribosomal protein S18 acetylase RimI-like enzyme